MKISQKPKPSMGITLRTALLSWLVTIMTLLIFISVIIPQQKQTILENLESKAHGVAVSLRDVVAGAAVNDDLPSVVDHCSEMLRLDPSLEYLVMTKNDGFSLIHDRNGWRSETDTPKNWRPDKREPGSGIDLVKVIERSAFHYAQPFDYSGIRWGWIHVGLSLEGYNRSVAMVYQRTGVLAVICILLSLIASMAYARRMVYPIHQLRKVVMQVSGGDLSARAEVARGDELGSLAQSFNSMTETLLQRDRILESVRLVARQFLAEADWRMVLPDVLNRIGRTANVSRAYLYENHPGPDGHPATSLRYEYVAPGEKSFLNAADHQNLSWKQSGLEELVEYLSHGKTFTAQITDAHSEIYNRLAHPNIQSVILVPIMVDERWWGQIGLEEYRTPRTWTDAERDSLHAVADILGATIERQKAEEALLEAKNMLEVRVKERTWELQEQVLAKEKARAELAEAQNRLLEISRRDGMAEISIGVLHNVGNVLNSVNVSTTLLVEYLRKSRAPDLARLAELLKQHEENLGDFFASNPKGRLVPAYVQNLARVISEEHASFSREMETLRKHVDHIREIVAMQQCYARVSGVVETVLVSELVEDAIRLNGGGLERHRIRLHREYAPTPPIALDKHKVIQILINLIRNAKLALIEKGGDDKEIKLRIAQVNREGDEPRVQIQVIDNGIGISPENRVRIFSHGFTTRKDGHGFGLHSGAIAARELGGSLACHSDGVGLGAAFTLEFPLNARKTT